MSTTVSVGVYGASYWSYMASDIVFGLRDAARNRRLQEGDIPRNIFLSAKKFFDLALAATDSEAPTNPSASINAYVIASDAATGGSFSSSLSDEDLRDLLARLSRFVSSLESPRDFKDEDIEKADELSTFLRGLAREGHEERYAALADFDRSQAGVRFW